MDSGTRYSWGSFLHLIELHSDYDLAPNPGEGWISGARLLSRWETNAQDLIILSSFLPVYLWRKETASMERINDKTTSQWDMPRFQRDPCNWIDVQRKVPPNSWFSVPQWWWCEIEDVKFYEKLEHEKGIEWVAARQVTLDWLSPKELLKRWSKRLVWLELKVKEMMLPVYSLSSFGLHALSEDALSRTSGGSLFFGGGGALLDDCLFKLYACSGV